MNRSNAGALIVLASTLAAVLIVLAGLHVPRWLIAAVIVFGSGFLIGVLMNGGTNAR